MRKRFNDTGLCIPGRHYMVEMSGKIKQIIGLIEHGEYFTINRPRQFGKTTTLFLLAKQLNEMGTYHALNISFEAIDTDSYQHQEDFITLFLDMLRREFEYLDCPDLAAFVEKQIGHCPRLPDLSRVITQLLKQIGPEKGLVLSIDEIDKSANNQLFLDFLAMLRNKYLLRNAGKEASFQSVVLTGVHDIKTLKTKIRPEDEKKFNSPWNIAVDFEVDLHFHPREIETMLRDYCDEKQIEPDIPAIAEKLYYYTSGYPYLVSKLCKFIDEKIVPQREDVDWKVDDVEAAFRMIVDEAYTTTLFDSLTKNLENDRQLYETVFNIVINGKRVPFNITVPEINSGYLYGIFRKAEEKWCKIYNRIYEQRIYSYMMTKLSLRESEPHLSLQPDYYTDEGLNLPVILQKFQAFMKEHASRKDEKFLEREGRLLFLSFLRPILNGKGFEFKEPNVSDERRMDLAISYRERRYVLELKRWYGPKAHQEGLEQLSEYLDIYGLKQGYLLIYDFSKNKEYIQENIRFQDKDIFAVWV